MSVVRIDGIEPDLKMLSTHQRYIFGSISANPLNRKSIDNLFVPTALAAAETLLDFRNSNSFSGFRLRHETALGDTIGKLKIQSFTGGSTSGTDLLVFNNDNSITIPGVTTPKYILQQPNASLANAQALSVLTTGLLKNTTTTGVLSTAVVNTDYYAPGSVPTPANGGDATNKTFVDNIANAPFIIKTSTASVPNAQVLGALTTGLLKNTTTTGVLSIAVSGTDYATLAHRLDQFAAPNTSLNLNSQRIINLLDPINPQEGATKAYVDSAVDNNFGPQVALPFLELDWNWANPGAQATYIYAHKLNDAFTTKALNTRIIADDSNNNARRFWSQSWNIGASNPTPGVFVTYGTATVGFSPSFDAVSAGAVGFTAYTIEAHTQNGNSFIFGIPVSMNNWRITNLGTPLALTDAANRQYVLDQISLGTVTLTGSVTGNGLVNGSFATSFSNSQSVSGDTQTFTYSNALTTSIFALQNTNASALTRFKAGSATDYIETGYDGSNDYSYFNLVGGSNDRYAFRFGGTGVAALTSAGLFGIGTVTPTQAKLVVIGGVQNQTNEDSIIRAISSSNFAKIELQCTNGSGKLFEFRASNAGNLDITDRTGGATRMTILSAGSIVVAGNIGLGGTTPNAQLQLSNTTASRKLVIYETANNDHQVKALGHDSNVFRFQTNATSDSFVFYAGTSSSTSNEVARILGTGAMQSLRIQGNGSAPSSSAGTAAGTSPTLTVSGSEISGTFTVVAGSIPSGTIIATFTLASAMPNSTYGVVFTPANQATGSLATMTWISVTSTTQFTINNLTALVNGTTYKWNYHIIGC